MSPHSDPCFSDILINSSENIGVDLFALLLDFRRCKSKSRTIEVSDRNVQHLRTAVQVKRRSADELKKIDPQLRNERQLVWLAVRSFGLSAFSLITDEKLKRDRDIVMVGVEKDGRVLLHCTIPKAELIQDNELITKALETCPDVLKIANDEIRNKRSIVVPLLRKNVLLFEFCGESLRKDKKIIELALSMSGLALEFVSEEAKSDEGIVKRAMRQNPTAFIYASPNLLEKQEFMDYVLNAIKMVPICTKSIQILKKYSKFKEFQLQRYENGLEHPRNDLSKQDWIRILSKKTYLYGDFFRESQNNSNSLATDLDFWIQLSQQMGLNLDDSFCNILDIQREMIRANPRLLRYFDTSFRSDFDFMFSLLASGEYSLVSFCESFFKNRKFLIEALKYHPDAWDYCTEFDDELFEIGSKHYYTSFCKYLVTYSKDKSYIIRAIKEDSNARHVLKYKMKEDIEVQQLIAKFEKPTPVLVSPPALVSTDRIERMSMEEKRDKKLMIYMLKMTPMSFPYIDPTLQNDREVVLTAVSTHGGVLRLVPAQFRKDKEIVMLGKNQGFALADKSLQRDREVILNAAKSYGGILELLDRDLRDDREIVLQCIQTTPMSLEFASVRLRSDSEIIKIAYDLDPNTIEFSEIEDEIDDI